NSYHGPRIGSRLQSDLVNPQYGGWIKSFVLFTLTKTNAQGHLEFIPASERPLGPRLNQAFEQNVRSGTFQASDSLLRLLDQDTLINTTDSLRQRINVNCSRPGTYSNFGTMSTRTFRQMLSKPKEPVEEVVVLPSTTPRHDLTCRFWKFF
ncbi:hypothetical protein BGZ83_002477, partial [Gryganskiella cystojenkinii]